jgi:hypothetical protein
MVKKRRLRTKPRVNIRSEAHKKMWAHSANFAAPPDRFDDDKIYRIKINRVVMATDHAFHFRPSQDIQVSGKIANEIKDYICGAKVVG